MKCYFSGIRILPKIITPDPKPTRPFRILRKIKRKDKEKKQKLNLFDDEFTDSTSVRSYNSATSYDSSMLSHDSSMMSCDSRASLDNSYDFNISENLYENVTSLQEAISNLSKQSDQLYPGVKLGMEAGDRDIKGMGNECTKEEAIRGNYTLNNSHPRENIQSDIPQTEHTYKDIHHTGEAHKEITLRDAGVAMVTPQVVVMETQMKDGKCNQRYVDKYIDRQESKQDPVIQERCKQDVVNQGHTDPQVDRGSEVSHQVTEGMIDSNRQYTQPEPDHSLDMGGKNSKKKKTKVNTIVNGRSEVAGGLCQHEGSNVIQEATVTQGKGVQTLQNMPAMEREHSVAAQSATVIQATEKKNTPVNMTVRETRSPQNKGKIEAKEKPNTPVNMTVRETRAAQNKGEIKALEGPKSPVNMTVRRETQAAPNKGEIETVEGKNTPVNMTVRQETKAPQKTGEIKASEGPKSPVNMKVSRETWAAQNKGKIDTAEGQNTTQNLTVKPVTEVKKEKVITKVPEEKNNPQNVTVKQNTEASKNTAITPVQDTHQNTALDLFVTPRNTQNTVLDSSVSPGNTQNTVLDLSKKKSDKSQSNNTEQGKQKQSKIDFVRINSKENLYSPPVNINKEFVTFKKDRSLTTDVKPRIQGRAKERSLLKGKIHVHNFMHEHRKKHNEKDCKIPLKSILTPRNQCDTNGNINDNDKVRDKKYRKSLSDTQMGIVNYRDQKFNYDGYRDEKGDKERASGVYEAGRVLKSTDKPKEMRLKSVDKHGESLNNEVNVDHTDVTTDYKGKPGLKTGENNVYTTSKRGSISDAPSQRGSMVGSDSQRTSIAESYTESLGSSYSGGPGSDSYIECDFNKVSPCKLLQRSPLRLSLQTTHERYLESKRKASNQKRGRRPREGKGRSMAVDYVEGTSMVGEHEHNMSTDTTPQYTIGKVTLKDTKLNIIYYFEGVSLKVRREVLFLILRTLTFELKILLLLFFLSKTREIYIFRVVEYDFSYDFIYRPHSLFMILLIKLKLYIVILVNIF